MLIIIALILWAQVIYKLNSLSNSYFVKYFTSAMTREFYELINQTWYNVTFVEALWQLYISDRTCFITCIIKLKYKNASPNGESTEHKCNDSVCLCSHNLSQTIVLYVIIQLTNGNSLHITLKWKESVTPITVVASGCLIDKSIMVLRRWITWTNQVSRRVVAVYVKCATDTVNEIDHRHNTLGLWRRCTLRRLWFLCRNVIWHLCDRRL